MATSASAMPATITNSGAAIAPSTDSARMPTNVIAMNSAPAPTMTSGWLQPNEALMVAPVAPVLNANHPTTIVARKPDATMYPTRPNVCVACSAKLRPVLPARWLSSPT